MKTLALIMVRGEVLEFAKLLSLATCCASSVMKLISSIIVRDEIKFGYLLCCIGTIV